MIFISICGTGSIVPAIGCHMVSLGHNAFIRADLHAYSNSQADLKAESFSLTTSFTHTLPPSLTISLTTVTPSVSATVNNLVNLWSYNKEPLRQGSNINMIKKSYKVKKGCCQSLNRWCPFYQLFFSHDIKYSVSGSTPRKYLGN